MNESSDERGSSGINFLWPVMQNTDFKNALSEVESGTGFNNISPIFTYSVQKNVKALWMGDMEHDFQEKIKDEVPCFGRFCTTHFLCGVALMEKDLKSYREIELR